MEMRKLIPAFKDYLWGGTKLIEEYKMKTNLKCIAEAWVLSAHPDGPSTLQVKGNEKIGFNEYLNIKENNKIGVRGKKFDEFPILIKFIDAKQPLSIQVHPDDAYALKVEHEYGKNEMWYIVDCDEGAYIYYGVDKTITTEELENHIENGTILDVLNKVYVKKGDCFFIEAGTLHAIGAGCLICEVQQNSNSTYRVYDFGRIGVDGKPRILHIEKALAVSKLVPSKFESSQYIEEHIEYSIRMLCETKYFTCYEYCIKKEANIVVDENSFYSLVILDGCAVVSSESQDFDCEKGESIFIPAGFATIKIKGKCIILVSSI